MNDFTNREENKDLIRIDRREFLIAGMASTAAVMLPRMVFGAIAKQPQITTRRKLGALEVSAIGLGCMSMNSGNYNPPQGQASDDLVDP